MIRSEILKILLTPRYFPTESGNYNYEFEAEMIQFLTSFNGNLTLCLPETRHKIILEKEDLLVLPGGDTPGDNSHRDEFEKKLIQEALVNNAKILGICRGAQLINVFFGGSLSKIDGHINVFRKIDGKVDNYGKCFHQYRISNLGKNLLAKSKDTIDFSIEVFESLDSRILGILSHPERGEFSHAREEIRDWLEHECF